MITTSKKLRVDYAPLDVVLDMQLLTPISGLMQTYNVASAEYEPDRSLAAQYTIIDPVVKANASDGSLGAVLGVDSPVDGFYRVNKALSNVQWLYDEEDISLSDISFTIDASDGCKGKLTIRSNIPVGTTHTLRFKATLLDPRKNVPIPVESDVMYLTCTTKAEDILSVSVTRQHFSYDVMHDKLAEFDYLVACDKIVNSSARKSAAFDGNEYLVTFPFIIKYGSEDLTATKSLVLQKYDEVNKSWFECDVNDVNAPEIYAFVKDARGEVIIDCRLVEKLTRYRITVSIDAANRTYTDYDEFTVKHTPSAYTLAIRNDSGLNQNKRLRREDVIVTCDNIIKPYPAAFLNIEWSTDRFDKVMNCGNVGLLDTWRADDGEHPITSESESIEVCVAHEPKGVYGLLTDGSSSDQFYKYIDGSFLIID